MERLKEKASKARQQETLQNIDEHLTAHKGGQNYNFEAAFGDIEAIVKAVAKEDTTLLIDNSDWKKDMGERSRRVCDWWRMLLNEKLGNVPAFKKAVKLLACVQVSSAFVERVFSQLAFIRRAVGDKVSRDVLELRTLIRVNNGLMEDYRAKI